MTSTPARRNEAAAAEITALADGAGPPANKMAILPKEWSGLTGGESVFATGVCLSLDVGVIAETRVYSKKT